MKQAEYDFSIVKRVVSRFNAYSAFLFALSGWEQAWADGQPCLPDNAVIGSTLKLVEAMDRPRMLDRFQGYAQAVLSDAEFAKLVMKPQVHYDFEQLLQFIDDQDNSDLSDEIAKLRDMVLAGERMTAMSPEIIDTLRQMITLEPRLSKRLYRYCLLLIPMCMST